jgi:RNA polymerase sigma-70 factor (ECF subfamily)
LYNFILRTIGSPDVAEDLLQEVFLRVVKRSDDFRGESKFTTWLYTIARNLCVDHLRKASLRKHASLDASANPSEPQGRALSALIRSDEPGADRQAVSGQLQEQITRAVEQLPEEQREVFLMRQFQQLPFRDIAAVVGVSENTVKSRMRYALERLREALSDYEGYTRALG